MNFPVENPIRAFGFFRQILTVYQARRERSLLLEFNISIPIYFISTFTESYIFNRTKFVYHELIIGTKGKITNAINVTDDNFALGICFCNEFIVYDMI